MKLLLTSTGLKNPKMIATMYGEKWPVYYSRPIDRRSTIGTAKVIATPFPCTTKSALKKMGRDMVKVVGVNGSTEVMPYLGEEVEIDGVVDIVLTGKTIKDNGLEVQGPPLLFFTQLL
ncbi:MAG: hypothetical protein V1905_01205 [bacterium]